MRRDQRAAGSLLEKMLEVELWTNNQQKENETCIGKAFIPIQAICEGPFHIDYQLLNNKCGSYVSMTGRKQPCGRISFNCTIEQQCVWGLRFSRATVRLRDGDDLNLNDGNLWSLVVSMTKNEGEELYHSSDTSIPVVTNEVAELDADKKVAEIGRFYAQHQLISISWQENELFVVSCNCTFREFVKEPLKLQLRNSAVALLSLRDCVERERLALRGVRRVLDLDGEGVQSLPGKPVYVVPP